MNHIGKNGISYGSASHRRIYSKRGLAYIVVQVGWAVVPIFTSASRLCRALRPVAKGA